MAYVYPEAETLENNPLQGNGQCVTLVRHHTAAPASSTWNEGAMARGTDGIAKGTIIATFVNGHYPNMSSGNHAAFYISQDAHGIAVIDQWATSPHITKRVLRYKGKKSDGSYVDPSNNGDAFSVVE